MRCFCANFRRIGACRRSVAAGASPAAGLEAFTRAIRGAADFIRSQRAPSLHVRSSNIYGAITVKFDSPDLSTHARAALAQFDRVAVAWEELMSLISSMAPDILTRRTRYKVRSGRVDDDAAPLQRYSLARSGLPISCKNALFAICDSDIAEQAKLFVVSAISSRSLVRLTPADVDLCRDTFGHWQWHASYSIRAKMFYIAAAAFTTIHQRLYDQSSTRDVCRHFRLAADPELSDLEEGERSRTKSWRCNCTLVDEMWKDTGISFSPAELAIMRPPVREIPDFAYIFQQNRGKLRYPQFRFAFLYAIVLGLVDLLLKRVYGQQPRNERPDELAEIHTSVCNATISEAILMFGIVC